MLGQLLYLQLPSLTKKILSCFIYLFIFKTSSHDKAQVSYMMLSNTYTINLKLILSSEQTDVFHYRIWMWIHHCTLSTFTPINYSPLPPSSLLLVPSLPHVSSFSFMPCVCVYTFVGESKFCIWNIQYISFSSYSQLFSLITNKSNTSKKYMKTHNRTE